MDGLSSASWGYFERFIYLSLPGDFFSQNFTLIPKESYLLITSIILYVFAMKCIWKVEWKEPSLSRVEEREYLPNFHLLCLWNTSVLCLMFSFSVYVCLCLWCIQIYKSWLKSYVENSSNLSNLWIWNPIYLSIGNCL